MSTATVAACLLAPATADAASSRVAALQVALRAHGVYSGPVDGVSGPGTRAGVRRIQRRTGSPSTASSARARAGARPPGPPRLRQPPDAHCDHRGWDVAALQFALETRGFPNGGVDGGFGPRTASAVRRAQTFYGLTSDGVAGPATLAALSRAPVRAPGLRRPIDAPLGDRYGPRGASFHAGLDFPAPTGTAVTAAATGTVVFAGYDDGWGNTVQLDHGNGLRTRYAHLSTIAVASAPPSPSARSSAASARPAPPPARTCTSRSRSAAPTPTRARRSASTESPRDRRARLRCGRR